MVSLIENFNTLVIAEVKNQQQEILTSFVAELLKNPALQENEEEITSLKEQFIQKLQLNKSDKPKKSKKKSTKKTQKKKTKPTAFSVIVSHYKTMDFQEKFKELLLTEEEKEDAGFTGRGSHFKLCKFILEKINQSPKHNKKLQKMIEQEISVFNAQQENNNAEHSDSTSSSEEQNNAGESDSASSSKEQNNAGDESDDTSSSEDESDKEN
jgi:hypothetical protein